MTGDEKQIVEGLKSGDEKSLSALLDIYGARVFSLIVRIVASYEDAQELTHDVFLKVYRNIHRYRGESSLSTWIYRIANNHAVSKLRKTKRKSLILDDYILDKNCPEDLDYGINAEDMLSALECSLVLLPTEEAMMVQLFYNENKSIEELSHITGYTVSNTKVKLHRIRKKLYIYINEIYERDR